MKCSWMKSIRSRRRVDALSKLPGYYNLIISDTRLKKMDGISLLDTVSRTQHKVPVIMIIGFGGVEIEEE